MANDAQHHSASPASDPPPYTLEPANEPALPDHALNPQLGSLPTYHTFEENDDKARNTRPYNRHACATVLGVMLLMVLLLWMLGFALSRRTDLSNDPTDPDGTRHGRGGYGVLS